jgi:hypothetical protein
MKIIKFLFGIFFYLLVLIGVYITHVNFFYVKVVFYSAILDSILASIIISIIIFRFNFFHIFSKFEKLQMIIIYLLIGYALAISVPTVIDRSLSFYILEKIEQKGGRIKDSSLEKIFKEEYISEHHLMSVRLTEQLQSGTIILENGCVKITSKGILFASISRNFRKHFLPKNRLLMGEYTDVLTDIFKNKQDKEDKVIEYACE